MTIEEFQDGIVKGARLFQTQGVSVGYAFG
jgi:hypothetical protein